MVNSIDFSKRLQKIMDRHDLNASSFAERISVGRSSISHILSGRNKPSLDFVINTVKEFPEVDLYWLLNGKGSYPKNEAQNSSTPSTKNVSKQANVSLPTSTPIAQKITTDKNESTNLDLFSASETIRETNSNSNILGKNVQKVILLYDDGSFESFVP